MKGGNSYYTVVNLSISYLQNKPTLQSCRVQYSENRWQGEFHIVCVFLTAEAMWGFMVVTLSPVVPKPVPW